MKRSDIYTLQIGGIQLCTAHTLNAAQAYKLYKLKKFVQSGFDAIEEDRKSLVKSVFGDNAEDELKELNRINGIDKAQRTDDENAQLAELKEKLQKADSLIKEMFDEDVDTSSVKAMPYEDWHKLQVENREVQYGNGSKADVLSGNIESILEDVLWKAPVEENE